MGEKFTQGPVHSGDDIEIHEGKGNDDHQGENRSCVTIDGCKFRRTRLITGIRHGGGKGHQ
uniref:Uncharacterized protein n=1 Tax=uncultured organism MedDCM-OCT-S11-C492 TaxID=743663 RepID=D6PLK4_9ZZZZ|nr:hypothetical protein [uncultured organism MedDCM-OCT-S11-C492]